MNIKNRSRRLIVVLYLIILFFEKGREGKRKRGI